MSPDTSAGIPDPDADSDSPLSPQEELLLSQAARSLRVDADNRWVEVSSGILRSALRASRRSRAIRAAAPGGTVHVSEHVIIAYVRDALDGHLPAAAVAGIDLDITSGDVFSGILIELIVQYGTPILPVADRARAIAASLLEEILGPAAHGIYIRTSHVHVSDVTMDDPQTS